MPHRNHHQQFHANPEIFEDPYLNTPKKYLSSLATCPNSHIAGCAPLNGPNNVMEHNADVFHNAPPATFIQLAREPKESFLQHQSCGYTKVGNQEFDRRGITPRSANCLDHQK